MLKIALIGFGYWGPNIARNIFSNDNMKLEAICDGRIERLDKARELYGKSVKYVKAYDDVLNDNNIEAVAIAVQTSMHYDFCKKALHAGKDVYIEKPFTDNVDDAIELKNLAISKGKIIHVDHIMCYHPVIKKIKELVDNGELGDILYFDCSRINLGQVRNDVNAMWDLSIHDLSIIDYLSNGAEPQVIKAIGEKAYSKYESVTFLNLKYENFLATITASWISPIKERRIIIAGTKKMLVYDDVDVLNKLIVYDKGFDKIDEIEYSDYVIKTRSGDGYIPKLEQSDALYNSLEHFRNCVEKRKESLTGPDSAIRLIKILEKADKEMEE